jgi:hypothetical protein
MDDAAEKLALQEVQGRLNARFPYLGEEVVEAAVRVAAADLTGPIRAYVPVLVEHIAGDRLASMVDYSSPDRPRRVVDAVALG